MEDKKLTYTFIIFSGVLVMLLVYICILGIIKYIENVQTINNNEKIISNFNRELEVYSTKTTREINEIPILKERFKTNLGIADYMEQLTRSTNEKNVLIYNNTVKSINSEEIVLEIILYGTLESVTRVIYDIENELQLTEINESKIDFTGNFVQTTLNLRIIQRQND